MQKTYIVCDRCGKEIEQENLTMSLDFGKEMGPAGSYESMGAYLDLCHGCAMKAIRYLLDVYNDSRVDTSKSKALYEWATKKA